MSRRTGDYPNCAYCGSRFYRPIHRKKMRTRCCCSKHEFLLNGIENAKLIICRGCGVLFHGKLKEQRFPIYCSRKCQRYCDGKDIKCTNCGTMSRHRRSQLYDRQHHFCSKSCLFIWQKGKNTGMWKGGFAVSGNTGHILVLTDEKYERTHKHRTSPSNKYRPEHRLVAEKYLGRKLKRNSEPILHLNGLPTDNRPANLYICNDRSQMLRMLKGDLFMPEKGNLEDLRLEYSHK